MLSPAQRLEFAPGASFVLLEKLGAGGMGEVWKARREGTLSRIVALKFILPSIIFEAEDESAADEEIRRFKDEAKLVAALPEIPGIVRLYAVHEYGDSYVQELSFVDGVSLRQVFDFSSREKSALEPFFGVALGARVAKSLARIHSARNPIDDSPMRVVHRDVSPSNIMLAEDSGPVLIDFGVAFSTLPDREALTRAPMLKGKSSYMAPEQARREAVTAASDQWALALVIYETVTGIPFYVRGLGSSSEEIAAFVAYTLTQTYVDERLAKLAMMGGTKPPDGSPTSAEALARVLRRALSLKAHDRFPNCSEFAQQLQMICGHEWESKMLRECEQMAKTLRSGPRRKSGITRAPKPPPEPGIGTRAAEEALRAQQEADRKLKLLDEQLEAARREKAAAIADVAAALEAKIPPPPNSLSIARKSDSVIYAEYAETKEKLASALGDAVQALAEGKSRTRSKDSLPPPEISIVVEQPSVRTEQPSVTQEALSEMPSVGATRGASPPYEGESLSERTEPSRSKKPPVRAEPPEGRNEPLPVVTDEIAPRPHSVIVKAPPAVKGSSPAAKTPPGSAKSLPPVEVLKVAPAVLPPASPPKERAAPPSEARNAPPSLRTETPPARAEAPSVRATPQDVAQPPQLEESPVEDGLEDDIEEVEAPSEATLERAETGRLHPDDIQRISRLEEIQRQAGEDDEEEQREAKRRAAMEQLRLAQEEAAVRRAAAREGGAVRQDAVRPDGNADIPPPGGRPAAPLPPPQNLPPASKMSHVLSQLGISVGEPSYATGERVARANSGGPGRFGRPPDFSGGFDGGPPPGFGGGFGPKGKQRDAGPPPTAPPEWEIAEPSDFAPPSAKAPSSVKAEAPPVRAEPPEGPSARTERSPEGRPPASRSGGSGPSGAAATSSLQMPAPQHSSAILSKEEVSVVSAALAGAAASVNQGASKKNGSMNSPNASPNGVSAARHEEEPMASPEGVTIARMANHETNTESRRVAANSQAISDAASGKHFKWARQTGIAVGVATVFGCLFFICGKKKEPPPPPPMEVLTEAQEAAKIESLTVVEPSTVSLSPQQQGFETQGGSTAQNPYALSTQQAQRGVRKASRAATQPPAPRRRKLSGTMSADTDPAPTAASLRGVRLPCVTTSPIDATVGMAVLLKTRAPLEVAGNTYPVGSTVYCNSNPSERMTLACDTIEGGGNRAEIVAIALSVDGLVGLRIRGGSGEQREATAAQQAGDAYKSSVSSTVGGVAGSALGSAVGGVGGSILGPVISGGVQAITDATRRNAASGGRSAPSPISPGTPLQLLFQK